MSSGAWEVACKVHGAHGGAAHLAQRDGREQVGGRRRIATHHAQPHVLAELEELRGIKLVRGVQRMCSVRAACVVCVYVCAA